MVGEGGGVLLELVGLCTLVGYRPNTSFLVRQKPGDSGHYMHVVGQSYLSSFIHEKTLFHTVFARSQPSWLTKLL